LAWYREQILISQEHNVSKTMTDSIQEKALLVSGLYAMALVRLT